MEENDNTKDTDYELSLKAFTWGRDSHGLYDYEDFHPERKTFTVASTYFLVRRANGEVVSLTEDKMKTQVNEGDSILCKIVPNEKDQKLFTVLNCSSTGIYEESIDKLWLVIKFTKKDNNPEEHKLDRGEILKLGRVRLKVKDYRLGKSAVEADRKSNPHEEGPIDITHHNEVPKDENDPCRICFNNSNTATNPLFAPCKCTGTVKFVHFTCLKLWLNLKLVSTKTTQLCSYYWKTFECEICKTIYPFCIEHNKVKYYLADVIIPETGDFIFLESLIHEKNTSRIINIVIPNEEKSSFKLGRGHESDMRINDISVSRFHATLKCKEQGFYIEDNNSKFGTLSLVTKVELSPELLRTVQVGRTAIYFSVKKAEPNQGPDLLHKQPQMQNSIKNPAKVVSDDEPEKELMLGNPEEKQEKSEGEQENQN